VICKLFNDEVLHDIEPLFGNDTKKKANALIYSDRREIREIIIEITAFQNENEYPFKVGVVNLSRNVNKIIEKVTSKHSGQIINTSKPCVLFILKPDGRMIDQLQFSWARDELFNTNEHSIEKISAVVFLNSYLLKSGAWYFNPNSLYPLTNKEKEYISSLCILDSFLSGLIEKGMVSK